eukprot:1373678-Rhodomonas_salina.1
MPDRLCTRDRGSLYYVLPPLAPEPHATTTHPGRAHSERISQAQLRATLGFQSSGAAERVEVDGRAGSSLS